MTYRQLKNKVLQLLNQYSVAGNLVASTYNNQADVLFGIPGLANDAMMEIATSVRPISARLRLDPATATPYGGGAWLAYDMPVTCWRIAGSGLPQFVDGEYRLLHTFRWLDDKTILLPKDTPGEVYVNYYRYPTLLSDTPLDTDVLDNVEEVHAAIPFYVAAHLAMEHDPFKYQALYNKYEDKLAKMPKPLQTDVTLIEDVYGFSFGGEYE